MNNNRVIPIPLRSPLKPIFTTTSSVEDGSETTSSGPATPTSEGSRIPSKLPCPPPPRKMNRCNNNSNDSTNNMSLYNGKKEFFITPPDLEGIFIRRHNIGC
ncbi:Cyclin-dependent protein kinase inhibitor SMR15 [Bienertia sinuspersici]